MPDSANSGAIDAAAALTLSDLVQYADGSIVSRTLVQKPQGTLTLFAFDDGQGLSEHSAPYDAYVTILDGCARLTIGASSVQAEAGQIVLMPADVPHAVDAVGRFKMMLTMIRA
jgi:quercetin dioxygenase-like cupin family protein